MTSDTKLTQLLKQTEVKPVLASQWDKGAVTVLDFSAANKALSATDFSDTAAFSALVENQIAAAGAKIGVGGYAENRIIYTSHVFTSEVEARSLHLGIDLWAPGGTPVFAPLNGRVHSFANNTAYRDYGPTIILEHELQGIVFYTLYGHLTTQSLAGISKGMPIAAGTKFAAIGAQHENVEWPPHLHFQLITDLCGKEGDFFGVAPPSESAYYLGICPNPNQILRIKELPD